MARVVVVASHEVDSRTLERYVRRTDELHVVVPAVEQSRLEWLANDDAEARERAEEAGNAIADQAPTPRAPVDVRSEGPSQAVLDAIVEHAPDRILVVVREGEDATWLEEGVDLPREIAGVPVIRVEPWGERDE